MTKKAFLEGTIFAFAVFIAFSDLGVLPTFADDVSPGIPSGITATQIPGTSNVLVQWNDNSNDETKFYISRQNESYDFWSLASVGENITSYVDTSPSLRYWQDVCYTVSATNGTTVSNDSPKGCVTMANITSIGTAYSAAVPSSVSDCVVAPKITSAQTISSVAGSSFSYTITVSGTPLPTTSFSFLPAGLTSSGDTISGAIVSPGTYTVTMNAKNSCGTESQTLIITINNPYNSLISQPSAVIPVVVHNQAPTLTLYGTNPRHLKVGDTFIDSGVAASDPEDGDILSRVAKTGIVNTDIVGTYYRYYNVTDLQGVSAPQQIREVRVDPTPSIMSETIIQPPGIISNGVTIVPSIAPQIQPAVVASVVIDAPIIGRRAVNSDKIHIDGQPECILSHSVKPKGLVVVTHGWNPRFLSWRLKDPWLTDMREQIKGNIKYAKDWDICLWDWTNEATTVWSSSTIDPAKKQGVLLGEEIIKGNYDKIHFIAHSSGAFVIQSAVDTIHDNCASCQKIHMTFLDAYTGDNVDEANNFGSGANFAEQYSSFEEMQATHFLGESEDWVLEKSFNFIINGWPHTKPENKIAILFPNHSYAHVWYENSIMYPTEYEYGFSLSLESGKESLPSQYPPKKSCYLNKKDANCAGDLGKGEIKKYDKQSILPDLPEPESVFGALASDIKMVFGKLKFWQN